MCADVSDPGLQAAPSPSSAASFCGAAYFGTLFPALAGAIFYGWRGMIVVGIVLLMTALTLIAARRVGRRGGMIRFSRGLCMALILGLMLPPTFMLNAQGPIIPAVSLALPAAGAVILGLILWLTGGWNVRGVHAALVAYLILAGLYHAPLVPQWVLQRQHLVTGDLLHAADPQLAGMVSEPWINRANIRGHDALWTDPASQRLLAYTAGRARPESTIVLLQGLIRDRLPPLEDLVIGGHPGAIGASSAIAVIIGGLFMLYRGAIDYRTPVLIVLSAYAALLILPVPAAITDRGPQFLWLAFRDPRVQLVTGVTLVHYELMASPLLFMAFFLATSPELSPQTKCGRGVFAIAVGALAGAAQLYVSVAHGPYLALGVVGVLTASRGRKPNEISLV